jgi:hypothetical protein
VPQSTHQNVPDEVAAKLSMLPKNVGSAILWEAEPQVIVNQQAQFRATKLLLFGTSRHGWA